VSGLMVNEASLVQSLDSEISSGMFGQQRGAGALDLLRSSGVYMADVEYDCVRFQRQLSMLRKRGLTETYCLVSQSNAPMPLDLGWVSDLQDPFSIAQVSPLAKFPSGLAIRAVSLDDARRGFIMNLLPFVRTRVGVTSGYGPMQRLDFEVHTRRPGGRVHYSRPYFPAYRNVFGSPTTPVAGSLAPGIYNFAVEYGDGQLLIDNGIYVVPPQDRADLQV
jgi:hypothetical protein